MSAHADEQGRDNEGDTSASRWNDYRTGGTVY